MPHQRFSPGDVAAGGGVEHALPGHRGQFRRADPEHDAQRFPTFLGHGVAGPVHPTDVLLREQRLEETLAAATHARLATREQPPARHGGGEQRLLQVRQTVDDLRRLQPEGRRGLTTR